MNWTLNRGLDNKWLRNQTGVITVRATDPVMLNNEITKYMNKGYACSGNPYTAVEYGKTTFYQTMMFSEEAAEQINAQVEAQNQARAEARAKRNAKIKAVAKKGLNQLMKEPGEEKIQAPEQQKTKEKNIAKAKLAGSLALGPLGLISKKNRKNIKDSLNKLLD